MPKKDKEDPELPEQTHSEAAHIHEKAAQSHRAAAEHHTKGDHDAAIRHAAEAHGHSTTAHETSNQARKKSPDREVATVPGGGRRRLDSPPLRQKVDLPGERVMAGRRASRQKRHDLSGSEPLFQTGAALWEQRPTRRD